MLELETRRLIFSKKSAVGIVVENSLLDAASAVVLSDNVGMRMEILEPGKKLNGNIYQSNLRKGFQAGNVCLEVFTNWDL